MLPTVTEKGEGDKNANASVRNEIDDNDKILNEEENGKESKESKGTHFLQSQDHSRVYRKKGAARC